MRVFVAAIFEAIHLDMGPARSILILARFNQFNVANQRGPLRKPREAHLSAHTSTQRQPRLVPLPAIPRADRSRLHHSSHESPQQHTLFRRWV